MQADMPQKRLKKNSANQAGNILIYILGAIFLLGLLAITVRGSNTPGAGIDSEQLMIRVAEVQQYGRELEQAVAYVLRNGHSEVDIRFAHPEADSAYGDITDTPSRQVFSRDGGGATYRAPPEGIQTTVTPWVFNGENQVREVGTSCTLSSCADLIAFLGNVSKDFCVAINNKNNIINVADEPPQDNASADLTTTFIGAYNLSFVIGDIAPEYLNGKLEGCFEGDTNPPSGTYHYYRVLLAR